MKRIMSIGDLKRYYEGHNPKRILFCTENQSWGKVENPMRASLAFTSMAMACNPNVICLKDGENMLWFERVKKSSLMRTDLRSVLYWIPFAGIILIKRTTFTTQLSQYKNILSK